MKVVGQMVQPGEWKRTDRQTDGRMLPSTFSPCFEVDNGGLNLEFWPLSHFRYWKPVVF